MTTVGVPDPATIAELAFTLRSGSKSWLKVKEDARDKNDLHPSPRGIDVHVCGMLEIIYVGLF